MEAKGQSKQSAAPVSHEAEDFADLVRALHQAAKTYPEVDRVIRSLMRAKQTQDRRILEMERENARLGTAVDRLVAENTRLTESGRKGADLRQDMLARAMEEASSAMIIIDPARGNVVYANEAAEHLFGSAVGVNAFPLFLNRVEPYAQDPRIDESVVRELPESYGMSLWKRLRASEARVYERVRLWTVMRKGAVDAALLMKAVRDANGHPWFIVEALEIESLNKDPLSGLFRREVGISAMIRELEHRDGKRADAKSAPISVIMMDIDDFKDFNTRFGYDGGNVVIRKVAASVRSQIRAKDIACRWFSGDEFLVVIYGGCAVATAVAERICRQVGGLRIRLTDAGTSAEVMAQIGISVGIAEAGRDDDWASLTKRAESELRQAKSDGKGRISGAHPALVRG